MDLEKWMFYNYGKCFEETCTGFENRLDSIQLLLFVMEYL